MPAHMAALQHEFTGNDRADWVKVAAAALDMNRDDLEATSYGRLICATDTMIGVGRTTIWLQPEADIQVPAGEEHFLVMNDGDLTVSAIVDDGICAIDDVSNGMIRAHVWNTADEPFVLSRGEPLARCCKAPASIVDKREDGWTEARDLYDAYAASRAELYDRTDGPKDPDTFDAVDGIAALSQVTITNELRKRIQSMDVESIKDGIRTGSLDVDAVVQSIIPVVTMYDGVGGAATGILTAAPADGRVFKMFLAIDDDDDAINVLRARTGGAVPVALHSIGTDVADTLDLVLHHVPRSLCDHLLVYASPPNVVRTKRHDNVVGKLETLRLADTVIATVRLLSPTAVFILEQHTDMEPHFRDKFAYSRAVDIGAMADLPQQHHRLLVSNAPIDVPAKPRSRRATLASTLGVSGKLYQFNAYNLSKPASEPSFAVTQRAIRVGASSRVAKPLSVTDMARLQGLDEGDIAAFGNLPNASKRSLVAKTTPPRLARLLGAAAAIFIGSAVPQVAQASTAFVHREPAFDKYISAVCNFTETTAHLDAAARGASLLDEHLDADDMAWSTTEEVAATTSSTAATNSLPARAHPAVRRNEPCTKLYDDLSEQERADRRRSELEYEKSWKPDWSDVYPASASDVLRLLDATGLPARAKAGELEEPETTLKFMQDLILVNFPLIDNKFRISGPTRMELRISDVVRSRGYQLRDPSKRAAAKYIINDLLERNVIYENPNSAFSSPMLLVPKKHKPGETDPQRLWRSVCDYRALNKVTMTDNYSPPPVDVCIHAIAGKNYFTLLDLEKGYWGLALHPESMDYTTFVVPGEGSFAFRRMVMGLRNSSAVFQMHVDRLLAGALFQYCVAYLDDLAIYSETLEEHKEHIDDVFGRLLRSGHNLNLGKCEFLVDEMEYLGYTVSKHGIKPLQRHVSGIEQMKLPTTLRELQCFIGLVNYERRFIDKFAEKMRPLTLATARGVGFTGLTDGEAKAFKDIKRELAEYVLNDKLLYFPDFTREIEIHTDASISAIGGWAFQRSEDGEIHPIAYVSRTVKEAEKAYGDLVDNGAGGETREIELLALIWVLDELDYLLHSAKGVKVDTDHRNITWLRHQAHEAKNGKGNNRLLRWALKLDQYDHIDIRYRRGDMNPVADALSRLHEDKVAYASMHMIDVNEVPCDASYTGLDEHHVDNTRAPGAVTTRHFVFSVMTCADPRSLVDLADLADDLTCTAGEEAPKPDSFASDDADARLATRPRRAKTATPTSPLTVDAVGGVEQMKVLPHAVVPIPTLDRIKAAQMRDKETVRIRKLLEYVDMKRDQLGTALDQPLRAPASSGIIKATSERYSLRNGMVCARPSPKALEVDSYGRMRRIPFGHEVYLIPSSNEFDVRMLRRELIAYCHAGLQGGHGGKNTTLQRLRARFYWTGMNDEVSAYVNACIHCQLAKSPPTTRHGYLQSFDSTDVFDTVAIDILSFTGALSHGAGGEKHVLIILDVFSRFLIAVPMADRKMTTVCGVIIHHLFVPWGAPRRIVADQEFTAQDFKGLLGLLETTASYVTAYHSSSNPAERYCQHVQVLLRTTLNEFPSMARDTAWLGEWVDYLPFIVASHNSAPYSRAGVSDASVTPFEIVTGRRYRWPQDLGFVDDPGLIPPATSLHEYWTTKREHMANVTAWVRRLVKDSRAYDKSEYDLNRKYIDLAVNEKVIVRVPTRKGKLVPEYVGPCTILAKESDLIYIAKHDESGREHRLHVDRLRRYTPLIKLPSNVSNDTSAQTVKPAPTSEQRQTDTVPDPPAATATGTNANTLPQRVEEGEMVMLRRRASDRIYIGRVIDTFPDCGEFNLHYYVHQGSKAKYDVDMPVDKRRVMPEYYYTTKGKGELRHYGTNKPRAHSDKPYVCLVDLVEFELLASGFEPAADGTLPADVVATAPTSKRSKPASSATTTPATAKSKRRR